MNPALRWLASGINGPLLIGAIALLLHGATVGDGYSLRLLTLSAVYALLGLGYQFVFGHAGALSLAQGAFFGFGAYVTGIFGSQFGWTFAATFPLSILLPVAMAIVVAVPVLRLESHYFALATLGIAQVVLLLAVNWQSVTGGANGLSGVPGIELFGWRIARGMPLLLFATGVLGLGLMVAWQFGRGLNGLAYRTMRSDDIVARSIGIDSDRLRFKALLLSAAFAGAAGAIYVHSLGVISPEALQFPIMVACLALVVIGGRTQASGAVIGALLIVHLPEWFRGLEQNYLIGYGSGILVAILFAPDGIVGRLLELRRRLLPEPPEATPAPLPPGAAGSATMAGPLLEIVGLGKSFGGIVALADVSLNVPAGAIVGLIGPNGSGKTTLLNLVSGLEQPDAGRIILAGEDVTHWQVHRRANAGLARGFQTPRLIPGTSLLDNVAVAGAGPGRGLSQARREAVALLAELGIGDRALVPADALPTGIERRVEIARALALRPGVLMLDEPMAGLSDEDRVDLATRLRRLAAGGLALLVVEHNMPFLMAIADRVACLDAGRLIAIGTPDEVRSHPQVLAAYLGRVS